MNNNNNVIGLIGGMSAYASAYFYKLLLKKSGDLYGVKNNNDYPEILINSIPIPDFISDTRKLKEAERTLISRVKRLNGFGCNTIAMVCNTAHILYPKLLPYSQAKFLSLIALVAKRVNDAGMKRVGLFATPTTIKLKLYQKELAKFNIDAVTPNRQIQKLHEKIIRDVIVIGETNLYKEQLCKITKRFIQKNHLDGVILVCTELPLIFPTNKFTNVIDCLDVLADELLSTYFKNRRRYEHS